LARIVNPVRVHPQLQVRILPRQPPTIAVKRIRREIKIMAKNTTKIDRKVIGMNTPVWFWYNSYLKKWRATVHINAEACGKSKDEAYMLLLKKIVSDEEEDGKEFNDIMSAKD
jgi:hypothetical protein